MIADVQRGIPLKVCLHFHVLIRHGKGRPGGVVLVLGQEVVCFLTAYHHRPADEVLSLRCSGCQVHGCILQHGAAARYGRIAVFNVRSHMIADVQRGNPLEVCRHLYISIRHGKGHLGGVVRVRLQEGRVLLNTIHLHRPAGKALVGFQRPARCCYSIALSSFGLIHSAVYRCDVIRNIAIIRFRLNIIGGHGQGRSGFGAILQQIGKFCFVRDFSLSTIYDFIQFPAFELLALRCCIRCFQRYFRIFCNQLCTVQLIQLAVYFCGGYSLLRIHIIATGQVTILSSIIIFVTDNIARVRTGQLQVFLVCLSIRVCRDSSAFIGISHLNFCLARKGRVNRYIRISKLLTIFPTRQIYICIVALKGHILYDQFVFLIYLTVNTVFTVFNRNIIQRNICIQTSAKNHSHSARKCFISSSVCDPYLLRRIIIKFST